MKYCLLITRWRDLCNRTLVEKKNTWNCWQRSTPHGQENLAALVLLQGHKGGDIFIPP